LNQVGDTLRVSGDPIAPSGNPHFISAKQLVEEIVDGRLIHGVEQQKDQSFIAMVADVAGSYRTNGGT
jgi:hypothetical protein